VNLLNRVKYLYKGGRTVYPVNRKRTIDVQTRHGKWVTTDSLYILGREGQLIKVLRVKL